MTISCHVVSHNLCVRATRAHLPFLATALCLNGASVAGSAPAQLGRRPGFFESPLRLTETIYFQEGCNNLLLYYYVKVTAWHKIPTKNKER